MRRGECVLVEDITASPIFANSRTLEVLLKAGVRAVQSTPIVNHSGAMIGMFSTHFCEPHRPDPRELRLLDLLARQAGAFIERDEARVALTAKERQLGKITESVGSPIAQCGRDLRYVFVNEAYARLIRLPVEQIIGRPIVDVVGAEACET
jgi:GAF domain-containing protein